MNISSGRRRNLHVGANQANIRSHNATASAGENRAGRIEGKHNRSGAGKIDRPTLSTERVSRIRAAGNGNVQRVGRLQKDGAATIGEVEKLAAVDVDVGKRADIDRLRRDRSGAGKKITAGKRAEVV